MEMPIIDQPGIGIALTAGSRPQCSLMTQFPSYPINQPALMRHVKRGFTLIELLVVVVVIGILASISVPKFQATKGKAYFAGMKSDLHNLTTAQEAFFYDHAVYTTSIDSLKFLASHGDVIVVLEATSTGWSATSQNPQSYPHFCALYLGTAAAVPPATSSGVVACQ